MALVNPIKRVRLSRKQTLEEFSAKAGVHVQALYLNERSVYPNILPKLEEYLVRLGENRDKLNEEYLAFQEERRQLSGGLYDLEYVNLGEPIFDEGHPFVQFREGLGAEGLSRMAFSKSFCVHPAQLYRLETGGTKHLPEQLREALRTAGMPDIVIRELESRCEEYIEGAALRATG